MMDLKTLRRAIDQIAEEKGIDAIKILDAIESSIAAAYKKEYEKKGEIVKAKFDLKTGELKFWQVKTVVDETTVRLPVEGDDLEDVAPERNARDFGREDSKPAEEVLPHFNADRHIMLDEAKKISASSKSGSASDGKKNIELGAELEFPLETQENFGRIAAQTAKQVVLQKLREAERESVVAEFKSREGEIASGSIQRFERGNAYIDLGRAIGIMFHNESVPGEHYKSGDRLKFLILAIQEETRTPGIILSRAHPKFIGKLFALEVPEVNDGTVEIKAIAREPGSRTKIAVSSNADGVDPVGACVGQRGTRVMAVSNELSQEKIDIIQWSEDPSKFIANALSPAKVTSVEAMPRREAKVFIPDDQLSLAIGKGGQNVRLAAKLTGWRIDVRSQSKPEETQAEGLAETAETKSDQEPEVKAE